MNSKSTREITSDVRAAIKSAGIKGTSVRFDEWTTDAEITITIRSADQMSTELYDALKAIGKRFEIVKRDPMTGEYCSGGNVYITVSAPDGPCVVCGKPTYWKHAVPCLDNHDAYACEHCVELPAAA